LAKPSLTRLEEAGLKHPLMDEIRAASAAAPQKK
jgi:hypothetical protein